MEFFAINISAVRLFQIFDMILNTPSNTFAKHFAGLLLMSTGKRLNKRVQWYEKGFMPYLNIVFSV